VEQYHLEVEEGNYFVVVVDVEVEQQQKMQRRVG
jgi:hemerythrin superfamily protein